MARILIVDDDPSIIEILGAYLRAEGHVVLTATNGLAGREQLPHVDLAILDWMLPEISGIELARAQRLAQPDFPILLLSARGEEEDKLRGLEIGADDYVTKPFSPREIIARVRALLRRVKLQQDVQAGGLHINEITRTASLDGNVLALSKLEFDLLITLARHPGFVWSRDRLLERIWGADFPGVERVVDVHMAGLRKKLGEQADAPRFIETVRGVGYRFKDEM